MPYPKRTHCKRGHRFRTHRVTLYRGVRLCKDCRLENSKKYRDTHDVAAKMRKARAAAKKAQAKTARAA